MADLQRARKHRFSVVTAILLARMQQFEAKFPSRSAFLRAIGVSEASYYLMLRRVSNPTIETMERIAEGLGITVYELIGNIDIDTLRKRLGPVGIDFDKMKATIDKSESLNAAFENMLEELGPERNNSPAPRQKTAIASKAKQKAPKKHSR